MSTKFSVQRKLEYGECHKVVGNHPSLGNWNVEAAPTLRWSEGHVWQGELQLPTNTQVRRNASIGQGLNTHGHAIVNNAHIVPMTSSITSVP